MTADVSRALQRALLAGALVASAAAAAQGTAGETKPSLNDRRLGVIKAQTSPEPGAAASGATTGRPVPRLAPATGRSLQDARRQGAEGNPVLLPSAATAAAAAAASAASATRP